MKVLKFGAVWCPGCLIMRPRWQEVEKENPWLETEYYDYDQNNEVAKEWNVKSVLPMFIFVDASGKEITRINGEYSKDKLVELINQYKEN